MAEICTLPSGLRVVVKQQSGITNCGVVTGAGTRDEKEGEYGLAHFVEHTIFKGTLHRQSRHIASRMESIGGELNAYTTKEETVIYTTAPAGYLDRAAELLADLVTNPSFPTAELEREKEVVIDEINSYLDSPSDAIFDEYEDLMYAGSPLGHNILGTPQSVRGLTSADCHRFVNRNYTPSRMVVYCVSELPVRKAMGILEKRFESLQRPGQEIHRTVPVINAPFDRVHEAGCNQAHTLTGVRIFGRNDPRRFALFLLNNYLGGPGMNSVLNRELRDKRGLVYTVESIVAMMGDCGAFMVYWGCDKRNTGKCRALVSRELERLASVRLSDRQFEAARRQYLGQMQVAASYRESMAMGMGKSLLHYGVVHTVADTAARIRELTAEDLRRTAAMILDKPLSTLTLC